MRLLKIVARIGVVQRAAYFIALRQEAGAEMRLLAVQSRQRRVNRVERVCSLVQRELRLRQPVQGKHSRLCDAEHDCFRVGGQIHLDQQLAVLLEAEVCRHLDRFVVAQCLLLERRTILGLTDFGEDLAARGAGPVINYKRIDQLDACKDAQQTVTIVPRPMARDSGEGKERVLGASLGGDDDLALDQVGVLVEQLLTPFATPTDGRDCSVASATLLDTAPAAPAAVSTMSACSAARLTVSLARP